MTIDQMLKTRRAELGVSQEVAAVQIGTTRLTYSRWEKGKALPDSRWIEQLATWLERPRWRVSAALGFIEDEAASVLAEHLGGQHSNAA